MDRAAEAFDKFGHQEHYLLASARDPDRFAGETDLFGGIQEDE
jgi:hypothetical protein